MNDNYNFLGKTKKHVLKVGDELLFGEFIRKVLDCDSWGFRLDDNNWYRWGGYTDTISIILSKKKKRRVG